MGYAIFLSSTLILVGVAVTSPDLCVASVVFAAGGIIVRILLTDMPRWREFVMLGAVLALGYYSKSFMFPMAFACFAMIGCARPRKFLVKSVAATILFLTIAAPFIAFLSQSKGRVTFGDQGRLAYAWYVNGSPMWNWQGGSRQSGSALHPTQKIGDKPTVFAFSEPIHATYSPWYDSSYWSDGLKPYYNLNAQLSALVVNLWKDWDIFFSQTGALTVGLALICLIGYHHRSWRELLGCWPLVAISAVAFAAYSLIHVEGRLVGPFVALLWAGLLINHSASDPLLAKRHNAFLIVAATLGVVACSAIGDTAAQFPAGHSRITPQDWKTQWAAPLGFISVSYVGNTQQD
jgi:hypothetical protein